MTSRRKVLASLLAVVMGSVEPGGLRALQRHDPELRQRNQLRTPSSSRTTTPGRPDQRRRRETWRQLDPLHQGRLQRQPPGDDTTTMSRRHGPVSPYLHLTLSQGTQPTSTFPS